MINVSVLTLEPDQNAESLPQGTVLSPFPVHVKADTPGCFGCIIVGSIKNILIYTLSKKIVRVSGSEFTLQAKQRFLGRQFSCITQQLLS